MEESLSQISTRSRDGLTLTRGVSCRDGKTGSYALAEGAGTSYASPTSPAETVRLHAVPTSRQTSLQTMQASAPTGEGVHPAVATGAVTALLRVLAKACTSDRPGPFHPSRVTMSWSS